MLTALLLSLASQATELPPTGAESSPSPLPAAEATAPAWDVTPQMPGLSPAPAAPQDQARGQLTDASRAARLLLAEDVSGRAVEQLTLAQLYWERHRLTVDFPGLGGPIGMMAGGGVGAILSGVLTGLLLQQTTCSSSYLCFKGSDFAPFFGVIAAVAAGVAIIGLVLFATRLHVRDDSLARRARINARLGAFPRGEEEQSGSRVSAAELAALRLEWLQEEQPGVVAPMVLMAVGLGACAYAILLGSSMVMAVAAAVVSGVLLLSGGTLLGFRLHDRALFNARLKRLRDGTEQLDADVEPGPSLPAEPTSRSVRPVPPASTWQPPPPPIAFAMAFSF